MTVELEARTRTNPYVGPRPFRYGETLYGRDREVNELLDLLVAERIVLLYSPSGAGKTSLVEAGLRPRLEREGFRILPVIRVSQQLPQDHALSRPYNRYLMSTLLSLEEGVSEVNRRTLDDLAGMHLDDYLATLAADVGEEELDNELLIIDQFEEILTLNPTDQDAKAAFLTELGGALRDRRRWALFVMREDFVPALDPYLRLLPTRLATTMRLDFLDEEAASQAMIEPAHHGGVSFTRAAASQLVTDLRRVRVQRPEGSVEEPGPYVEPVQLQVVCLRLWERMPPGATTITEADVAALGDVDSALAGYYRDRVAAVAQATRLSEYALRNWFEHELITEQGFRNQVLQGPSGNPQAQSHAVELLVGAHLVRPENRRGATWYELAHDRLIEPVQSDNAAWREEHLTPFQLLALQWERSGADEHFLLAGDALAAAEREAADRGTDPTSTEREFLAASRDAEARAQQAQGRRRSRRLALLAGMLCLLVITSSVLAVQNNAQAKRNDAKARQNRAEADSRRLAADATRQLAIDPAVSMALALNAIDRAPTPEAEAALRSSLSQSHLRAVLRGHTKTAWTVVFSRDGRRVLTSSDDGTARIWDPRTGETLRVLKGHKHELTSAEFSPDGQRVVTASWDKTARIWDAATGKMLHELKGHTDGVNSAEFSPDGQRVVTASWDKTARIWDARTSEELATTPTQAGALLRATFSPDGEGVAAAGLHKTALFWSWRTTGALVHLQGHSHSVNSIEFSPGGTRIVTAGDKTVRIWDVNGKPVAKLAGHNDEVTSASFSRDGQRLVSSSVDGTARVWEIASRTTVTQLRGHTDGVLDAAFNAAGTQVATVAFDGEARVWEPARVKSLLGIHGWVLAAEFNHNGRLIAGAGEDGTVRVWRADTGAQLRKLDIGDDPVNSLQFNPRNDNLLVIASDDGTVSVWDWRKHRRTAMHKNADPIFTTAFSSDGELIVSAAGFAAQVWKWRSDEPVRMLNGHDSWVYAASFSPSGTKIVTAAADRTARIWDTATGRQLAVLSGHTAAVNDANFNRQGTQVVTASADRTARIWDVATGRQLYVLSGHASPLATAAFDASGTRVVTGDVAGTTGVWDVKSGHNLAVLSNHQDFVNTARFSPKGDRILTASDDGTARLYACTTCRKLDDLIRLARGVLQHLSVYSAGQARSLKAPAHGDQVGDCYLSNGSRVNCARPHSSELFAVIQYPSRNDTRFDEHAVSSYGESACRGAAFGNYVGLVLNKSRYDVWTSPPNAKSWRQFDREIWCFLSKGDEQTSGSARGSRR
jgi:WD40 repeat protein